MPYVTLLDRDGKLAEPTVVPEVKRTEDEWRARLTPEQFAVLRAKGTERPFCGGLLKNKDDGLYLCAGCHLPLFRSNTKFESGTGWPSFYQPVGAGNVKEVTDTSHGMVRTEIVCARCDSHLGHLFDDGPRPTGLRYCRNSESLKFVPEPELKHFGEDVPQAKSARLVLAGGCFWCVEAVFREIDGVLEVVSGYAGGDANDANYRAVCTGETGHAEAVEIIYDPAKVSLEKLLEVHFATHDPTTLNRQGADVGPQYRSAIFYANEDEKRAAETFIKKLGDSKAFGGKPIVTTLEPLTQFYPAEAYHQNFVCRNPMQGYVRGVALPTEEKARETFALT
jgi:peptide methionine sulfoxide reductase msrA/msrB